MIKKFIEVSLQHEGVHCYPAAGTDPALAEVSYLQYPHRHIFYITAKIEVFHSDRELEFIVVKHWLHKQLTTGEFNSLSCEMIGEKLIDCIKQQYGEHRSIVLNVFEDNENGAVVEYTPEIRTWSKR